MSTSKGLQSIVYGLIVVAIAVVFIIQFQPQAGARSSAGPKCAVEVKGRCITTSDFTATYRLVVLRNREGARSLGLKRMIADGLVERDLLVQDAERLGLAVSEEDVTEELREGRVHLSLPVDKADSLAGAFGLQPDMVRVLPFKNPATGKFDYKAYERSVRSTTAKSVKDFREMQRSELLAARMRELVKGRVRLSDEEVFREFARTQSTATIEYVTFQRAWLAERVVDTSERAVSAWIEAHKEEFEKHWESRRSQYLPECRAARHILVKAARGDDAARSAARARAEAALARVRGGEDFSAVAREVSEDVSSARGGDLGCFQKGRMVKPFEDAVFSLQPGELSGVLETEFGFHVVRLDAVAREAEAERLGRTETATQLLLAAETERLSAESAKKVLADLRAGRSFEEAVQAAIAALPSRTPGAPAGKRAGQGAREVPKADPDTSRSGEDAPRVQIAGPFSVLADPFSTPRDGKSVASLAFGLEKPGDMPNDVVALDEGYLVFRLKEKAAATRDQFEAQRALFYRGMLAEKQRDALAAYVSRLRATGATEVKINMQVVSEAEEQDEAPGGEE